MGPSDALEPEPGIPLAGFTTLGVGGAARWFATVRTLDQALAARRWAGERGIGLFVLGGGSNLVISDTGVDGLVVRMALRGCELGRHQGELRVEAAAGEPWDEVVARTVDAGFAGMECLSGIPGSVGGTPIQNVGVYGQDVSQTIELVTAIDRATGHVVELSATDCEFGYRQSRFKSRDRDRFVVTSVSFRLTGASPAPAYPDVTAELDRRGVRTPSVADVRDVVLAIRRRKGMVLDPGDPDTRSVGSFFMNPIVSGEAYARIAADASARGGRAPGFPAADGSVKVPAAWLIEQAGFPKGHAAGRTGLSTKHPLAIVNRGGATARDVVEFAGAIKRRVVDAFGVWLRPEPVFLGLEADETVAFLQRTPLMSTLLIEGGHRLQGRVAVEGNKNAALPLLAACLLTEEECVLTNVPRIGDVEVMARLLLDLGAEVQGIGTTTLRIKAANVHKHEADRSLVGRLRGSVLLLGPLLARLGRAHIAPPGGDFPARRTISTHIDALVAMGARQSTGPDHMLEAPDGLDGASMYLYEASVTGTETALLAAARARGTTDIRHAAAEPHVVELCEFLRKMGADVSGEGSSHVRITGSSKLHGAEHHLGGDYIEAGSWAVVAAITGGEVDIEGARDEDIEVVAAVLHRMRIECGMRDGTFFVKPSRPKAVRRITTGLWPSFPSDLVSLVTVLATQAEGRTLVHDWMYELRLFALEQMSGMGADLFLADAHRIIVTGPTKLRGGRVLDTRDLRSGMSLIAAGLAAEGQTRVAPLETVERGYSQLVDRLHALGAKVAKVEG